MAKAEFKAGGVFDFLSPDELNAGLKKLFEDWRVEAAKGPKPIRFTGNAKVQTDGSLTLGGANAVGNGRLGPSQSMYWSVKRIVLSGLDANVDTPPLYINDASPRSLVLPAMGAKEKFGSDELVLSPGDRLYVAGLNLVAAAGTNVTLAGSAFEIPTTMLYLLT